LIHDPAVRPFFSATRDGGHHLQASQHHGIGFWFWNCSHGRCHGSHGKTGGMVTNAIEQTEIAFRLAAYVGSSWF
jgi:hypothetical protein